MAAYDIVIGLALPVLLPPGSPINEKTFPYTVAAVRRVALGGQLQWKAYLSGQPLPDGRRIHPYTGAVAGSVMVSAERPFAVRVFSDHPGARSIEEGTRAYDMKRALATSAKVRISKTGARYLIIPFRHGTPGTIGFASVMPTHVHEAARALLASRVRSSFQVPSATGVHDLATRSPTMVTRRAYTWGGALPGGLAGKLLERHKSDPYAGMRRFDNPGGGSSNFLTFRVMSERSTGWIRPAMPGYWAARAAAQSIEGPGRAMIQEAFAEDVRMYLAQARAS